MAGIAVWKSWASGWNKRRVMEVAAVVAFVLILAVWRYGQYVVPTHDSMQAFHVFYFYYCSLFQFGAAPEWLPFHAFGVDGSSINVLCISPSGYLCARLGAWFGVRNVLALYETSFFLDQLVLVLGVYALVGRLLQSRFAVLFVTLSVAATIDWWSQLWWNFRLVLPIPLALALLLSFSQTRRPVFFWLSGIVLIAFLFGGIPYWLPVYFYLFVAACLPLLWADWRVFLEPFRLRAVNGAGAAVLLVLVGSYAHSASSGTRDQVAVGVPGRNPDMSVDITDFLSHAGTYPLDWIIQQQIVGYPVRLGWDSGFCPDQTLYVGLAPLVLACLGITALRSPGRRSVLAVFVATYWLTAAGALAMASYYVIPAMSYMRYLCFLYSSAKVWILVLAGFGLERLLARGTSKTLWVLALITWFAIDSCCRWMWALGMKGALSAGRLFDVEQNPALPLRLVVYLVAILVVVLAERQAKAGVLTPVRSRGFRRMGVAKACFAAAVGIDLLLFQVQLGQFLAKPTTILSSRTLNQCFQVRPIPFVAQRTAEPTDPVGKSALDLSRWIVSKHRSQLDVKTYGFVMHDACGSEFFTPTMSKEVNKLWTATKRRVAFFSGGIRDKGRVTTDPDPAFGCYTPKLFLTRAATQVADEAEATRLIHDGFDFSEGVLIETGASQPAPTGQTRAAGDVNVVEFGPDRLNVRARVDANGPAWLVYLDAFDPEWTATVDGQPARVQRANIAFKAVEVPPGEHTVVFAFRAGRWITFTRFCMVTGMATCLALAAGLVLFLRGGQECPAPSADVPERRAGKKSRHGKK